jgi:hypothetical protein
MFTLIKAKKTAFVKALSALKSRFSSKLINRSSKTYLAEKGWRRSKSYPGYEWQGYYRTGYGSFKGRVLANASPSFYVYRPPEALSSIPIVPVSPPKATDGTARISSASRKMLTQA